MKYKVGDKTLLGEITRVEKIYSGGMPENITVEYLIDTGDEYICLSENLIDAIIVKPKRNIDHLIELIESRKREEAIEFIDYDHKRNAPWANLITLLSPYIKPRKYPVLTPEELEAVKWLIMGGYESIWRDTNGTVMVKSEHWCVSVENFMCASILDSSSWITNTLIDIKELLKEQEGV